MRLGEGREGDWECSGCKNRNYAFRSFCNRCRQPRLLVDTNTPPDSKWLPRIGDWICTGCTNNNYASREKCKKCGQPKEVAAMPAVAIPGAVPAYSHHYARGQAEQELRMTLGSVGHVALQYPPPPGSNWLGTDRFGVHPSSTFHLGGNYSSGNLSISQVSSVPKGWRNGDWICSCGFHNYSSRAECKKCNASAPPALGTKRLASEEFPQESDNKRLNAGQMEYNFLASGQQLYAGFDQIGGIVTGPRAGVYAPYPSVSSTVASNPNLPVPHLQIPVQFLNPVMTPALLGKGAKQWRNGDWMCTSCSNHNYASRAQCNRCKNPREAVNQRVNVA